MRATMETESSPAPAQIKDRTERCNLCGATLHDADELQMHMEGHAEQAAEGIPPSAQGPHHKCSFCEASFDTAEQLKAHLGTAHEK